MKSAAKAYAQAGVDLQQAERIGQFIGQQTKSTFGPEVIGSGFFGSMFQLKEYQKPVLVSSADGVGTKLQIASLLDRHNSVGADIVNHSVNDILCCGAEPLFFLDYIAMGKLAPQQIEAIITGMAQACRDVPCSLIGGETAEMPGTYPRGSYDIAGFIVGVVEKKNIIDGSSIRYGDIILGLPSSGLHTNGYSLVRKVFHVENNPSSLNKIYPELGISLGEALLKIHHCYYHELKPLLSFVHGIAHITGGGFPGNISRILPQDLAAHIYKGTWDVPALFRLIQRQGNINESEMYQVFNMGIGMTIVCSPEQAKRLTQALPQAKVIGEITNRKKIEPVIID
ncbi:MAG: phosphoribosylformylglycinamidine cyclo-ligase [Dehalococcoidia bacterium]|nr:phosphoribosylformylglycinamidine cyclo-ligase [Dehalococcoidia bacterium]